MFHHIKQHGISVLYIPEMNHADIKYIIDKGQISRVFKNLSKGDNRKVRVNNIVDVYPC